MPDGLSEIAYASRRLPWRVRLAKWLLPKRYGVVIEEGWEDRRV